MFTVVWSSDDQETICRWVLVDPYFEPKACSRPTWSAILNRPCSCRYWWQRGGWRTPRWTRGWRCSWRCIGADKTLIEGPASCGVDAIYIRGARLVIGCRRQYSITNWNIIRTISNASSYIQERQQLRICYTSTIHSQSQMWCLDREQWGITSPLMSMMFPTHSDHRYMLAR